VSKRVDHFLSASHRTKRLASLPFGVGRQLTVWQNSHDELQYNATSGHVFSLYLKGGAGTRRVDGGVKPGRPGKLCIFPEGHSSEWQITEIFQFVHLYVADSALRGAFAKIHDQDARRLDITERTFVEPGALEKPLQELARAALEQDILAADIGFSNLVAALGNQPVCLQSGLSRKAVKDVNAWIDANIDADIRLKDLAAITKLSEYHFHRMFIQSCGMTPHNWVTHLRISRAKQMLKKAPMSQVALACGFSSQSHFIRRFKEHMGVTPGQYNRLTTS
jgi:AraC family transcriptional regulator